MEILNQLEKDSQHVLQRRSRRTGAAAGVVETAGSAPVSSTRQSRNSAATSSVPAGQKSRRQALKHGVSDPRSAGSAEGVREGLSSFALREVNKRKKQVVAESNTPAAKRIKANQQVSSHSHGDDNNVMDLLQRLEQESERILTGAVGNDPLVPDDSITLPKTRRRGASTISTASAQTSAVVEPTRASAKRNTPNPSPQL